MWIIIPRETDKIIQKDSQNEIQKYLSNLKEDKKKKEEKKIQREQTDKMMKE